jgi:hypothetical protein
MLKQDSNFGHRLWHALLDYAAEGHFEIESFKQLKVHLFGKIGCSFSLAVGNQ